MSITEFRANDTELHPNTCPRCGAALPAGAAFCNICGERLDRMKSLTTLLEQEEDITTRYRMTSLVRRRPFVNLYFASDFQQTANQGQARMVVIRDIDLTLLSDATRIKAGEIAQQEYDLLRQGTIPNVLTAIDLRYSQGHLFLVAAPPAATPPTGVSGDIDREYDARLSTLQDYLQSGQGLPSERHAVQWIASLCQAVDDLHRRQIVIGDLDPFAILYSGDMSNPDRVGLSLLISWLPPALHEMLPSSVTTTFSYFVAPEATQGNANARADVYSLGAILYLLLTGMPPGESTQRNHGRLASMRAPHEINGRISSRIGECVMQALALQSAERFESPAAFAAALRDPRYHRPLPVPPTPSAPPAPKQEQDDPPDVHIDDVETVRIIPLSRKDVERWREASRRSAQADVSSPERPAPPIPSRPETPRPPLLTEEAATVEEDQQESSRALPPLSDLPSLPDVPETPSAEAGEALPGEATRESQDEAQALTAPPLPLASPPARRTTLTASTWKQRITGFLRLGLAWPRKGSRPGRSQRVDPSQARSAQSGAARTQGTWLEQLKQVLLGQQQQAIQAAAIVETPLRVVPDQMYTLRIHVMGRNEPGQSTQQRPEVTAGQEMGLSRLTHGDTAMIEVRSVLHQSYAYVVQRATVTVPAEGYVAEVTIPMQSLSNGPTGRRDRLHIFFMDEHRHPLYEKPFAVEIFVSNHVKRGNEGHHVLTIPF